MNEGIYVGLSFAEYAAIKAVNHSRLGLMSLSPKHYQDPKPWLGRAGVVGNLIHTGATEATTLAERYAVADPWHLDQENTDKSGNPSKSKSTNYYRAKAAEFEKVNEGREIVSRDEYDTMRGVVKSIEADPLANKLINGPGKSEVTIVWEDPETGILCKGRIDRLGDDYIADIKSTVKLFEFERVIATHHYHRQQAFYRYGWSVLNGGELLDCYIVAVEKDPPFAVRSAPLSDAALDQGDREWRRLLNRVAECHESGCWPGPESPESWELPAWAVQDEPLTLTIGGSSVAI